MLDYYGSIIMENEKIDKDLIENFRNYNKKYILKIIQELRQKNILPYENSISGWMIFTRKYIIDYINNILELETNKSIKLLYFIRGLEIMDLDKGYDIDVFLKIYEKI